MSYIYSTKNFYYQTIKKQKKKIVTEYFLFKACEQKEIMVDKEVQETDEELWTRINQFIKINQVDIINIESIITYIFSRGGEFTEPVRISSDNINKCKIIGYRLFYKCNASN